MEVEGYTPTVISYADYIEACNDPKVHKFWREAREYADKLRREGRDHTIDMGRDHECPLGN